MEKNNVSLQGQPKVENGCLCCGKEDNKAYVQCDECERWGHLKCVGKKLKDVRGNKRWSCSDCVDAKERPQSTPQKDKSTTPFLNTGEASDHSDNEEEDMDPLANFLNKIDKKLETFNATAEKRSRFLEMKIVDEVARSNRNTSSNLELLKAEVTSYVDHQSKILHDKLLGQQSEINQFRQSNAIKQDSVVSFNTSGKFSKKSNHHVSFKESEEENERFVTANESVFDNTSVSSSKQPELTEIEKLTRAMNQRMHFELPDFSGDPKTWALFEAIYESTTAKGGFDEQQNVDRLRKALKGDARLYVEDLVAYSTTATPIMTELKERFGRPDRLILKFQDELLALGQLTKPNDPKLLDFSLKVKNFVATTKTLKSVAALNNDFILLKLEYKLANSPYYQPWQKLKAESLKKEKTLNIEDFSDYLKEKVRQMPPDYALTSASSSSEKTKSNEKSKNRLLSHNTVNVKEQKSSSCVKCDQPHPLYRCDQFKAMALHDKWNLVKQKKICSSCLATSEHMTAQCTFKRECGIQGCKKNHNRLMHKDVQVSGATPSVTPPVTLNQSAVTFTPQNSGSSPKSPDRVSLHQVSVKALESTGVLVHQHNRSPVLFKVVPIRLYGLNKVVDTFALLDDGSTVTLMDKKLYDELGNEGEAEQLSLQWTKGITRAESSVRTSLVVSAISNRKKFTLLNVNTVANIDLPRQSVNAEEIKRNYSHLRSLPLRSMDNVQPLILIGLEHAKFIAGTRTICGGENDPVACKTPLGWTIFGKSTPEMNIRSSGHQNTSRILMHNAASPDEETHALVKNYFTTENFGVTSSSRNFVTEEDERAIRILNDTIKLVNNRYEVGLLWKKDDIVLPNSYSMAFKRLVSEEKKLRKDPALMDWKNQHVRDLLKKGYARAATQEDLEKTWPRIWYSPTFVVTNKNKFPPKSRDVCDVAAQVNGVSLNTNLLKGPDNLAPLLTGLFHFREGEIAVNADVREMFHQIRIRPEDQQCQRFLWRDGEQSRDPTIYIFQAMMFGPTCSPSSSQFVKNHHANLNREKYPEAAEALITSTYVDDYFNSHSTIEEAFKVISNAIEICATMSFELVGVQSNSLELLQQLPQQNVKDKLVSLDYNDFENYVTKVLGMFWRAALDVYTFVFFESESTKRMSDPSYWPTKREILSTVMKLFDPLGFLSPFTIHGKIILQDIWRYGCEWDEKIPSELRVKWLQFITEMKNIEKIEIPRHYSPGLPPDSMVSLITFVDASEEAFVATSYFRFEHHQQVHVTQVMAKAKVAPIKALSVPQLELQAAVLGVRMAATIKNLHSIKIDSSKFMSDSKCVLLWINSKTYKFKSFVAVRVGEILDSSSQSDWYHVGTKDNVADDATRCGEISAGSNSSRWFRGPEFLQKPEAEWPVIKSCDMKENKSIDVVKFMIHVEAPTRNSSSFDALDSIKPSFKSSWSSLVRVVAFITRFISSLRSRALARREGIIIIDPKAMTTQHFVSPAEFKKAEKLLFRKIQKDAFPTEVNDLSTTDVKVVRSSSKILTLNPFFGDDKVLRMSSRAQGAKVSYASRNPAILPNKHELVDLLIQHHHENNQHMSEETIIADIRESVWIISIRVAVRRVKSNCQVCKLNRAKPVMPLMGQLPTARLEFGVKPFTFVGIDCFGPLMVKQARSLVKRYGIIFTCLTYRAVYIVLLKDMSLSQVMMAIRSLIARRGKSQQFFSDNGSNFIGSNNQLIREVKETADVLGSAVANRFHIDWQFIPAYSPWMGGAWERLIQSIKRSIAFTLNGETPTEDVLESALIEAELNINRRPLTHTPVDHEDNKPLTPNSVMFGEDDVELGPPGEFSEKERYSRQAHRRVQHLAQKFKRRWITEYLPEITRRSKWHKNTKPVEVNDLVIVVEPNETRNNWRRGRVIKVNPGPDGVVRSADVMLADKSIKLKRSVGRLAVLDVAS